MEEAREGSLVHHRSRCGGVGETAAESARKAEEECQAKQEDEPNSICEVRSAIENDKLTIGGTLEVRARFLVVREAGYKVSWQQLQARAASTQVRSKPEERQRREAVGGGGVKSIVTPAADAQ
eukprot:16446759-Heterocapsa_arctica.AAC.1